MPQKIINAGILANDGTGDTLRTGAQKINENFTELYNSVQSNLSSLTAGDGISIVSGGPGQLQISNSKPNEFTFKSIEVEGQDAIIASTLTDTLTVVQGDNIVITTDAETNTITFDIPSFTGSVSGTFTGDMFGTLTGTVQGSLEGDATGVFYGTVNSELIKVQGNPLTMQAALDDATTNLNNAVLAVNSMTVNLQQEEAALNDLQDQLDYWIAQPPSQERTDNINDIQDQIAIVETTISGYQSSLVSLEAVVAQWQDTVDMLTEAAAEPFASLTYESTTKLTSINRTLSVPVLVAGDDSTSGIGIVSAPSTLVLSSSARVQVSGSPFRLPNLTTVERDDFTASNGDLIYNTTIDKLQGYQDGSWINIDGT